ncbi:hypothetical protein F4811DRAFT_555469 [Daldinia bambusicola]|nr:hypothetical protein F4811DRAFT_555469 [Daldinia bambusicola]
MTPPLNVVRQILETQMLSQLDPVHDAKVKSGSVQHGNLENHLAENVNFHIVSEAADISRQLSGHEAVKSLASSKAGPSLHKLIDNTKPYETEIVHLIGSEQSPWVAAVLRNTATTKTGKPFKHEWVVLLEFDNQDHISTLKVYPDSHNLQNHSTGI